MFLCMFFILEPSPTEGPIKSPFYVRLSICLSIRQLDIVVRNGSLVFSDFLHDGS